MGEQPFIRTPRRTSTAEALQEAEALMGNFETKVRSPLMTFEHCSYLYDSTLKRLEGIEGLLPGDKMRYEWRAWEIYGPVSDLQLAKDTGPTFSRDPASLTSSREASERKRRLKLK